MFSEKEFMALSKLPRIISPMQKRLPLPPTACQIAGRTMAFDLGDVACHHAPSLNLPRVLVRQPPSAIVAAIPLKPAAGVVALINPSLRPPHRQRLAGGDSKKIQRRLGVFTRCQSRPRKPCFWKLIAAVAHVVAAENAHLQHFHRRQLRAKIRGKRAADRRVQAIAIIFLHLVADGNKPPRRCGVFFAGRRSFTIHFSSRWPDAKNSPR